MRPKKTLEYASRVELVPGIGQTVTFPDTATHKVTGTVGGKRIISATQMRKAAFKQANYLGTLGPRFFKPSPAITDVLSRFRKTISPIGKMLGPMMPGARFAWGATFAFFGASAAISTMGSQLWKRVQMRPISRTSGLRSGPGYISWGKTSGMPANHLSTDGLGLSLSNLRHTSVI